jgi:hypothetical protein
VAEERVRGQVLETLLAVGVILAVFAFTFWAAVFSHPDPRAGSEPAATQARDLARETANAVP